MRPFVRLPPPYHLPLVLDSVETSSGYPRPWRFVRERSATLLEQIFRCSKGKVKAIYFKVTIALLPCTLSLQYEKADYLMQDRVVASAKEPTFSLLWLKQEDNEAIHYGVHV